MSSVIYLQNPPDNSVTTAKIVNANVTPAKLSQPYTQSSSFTLSGISYDVAGIPSWATWIAIKFVNLSMDDLAVPIIQLGDSGGIENTGYNGAVSVTSNGASPTTASITSGLALSTDLTASSIINGEIVISKVSGNTWIMTYMGSVLTFAIALHAVADKALSDVLTQIRFTSFAGTASFDGGTVSISWQ